MAVDYKFLKEHGFMQQVQKDHFSLRIGVVGGNLTSAQLSAIADISEKYGAGYVHLTSRQAAEIPFIKLEDIDKINEELTSKGLKTAMCGPQVRTITACHGSSVCRFGCIDTYAVALELSQRYEGRPLPHKFKFGITGCPNNCLKAEENDFGIKGGYCVEWIEEKCKLCGICSKNCRSGAIKQTEDTLSFDENKCSGCGKCVKSCPFKAWKGESGYFVFLGGTFGNRIARGESFLPLVRTKEELFKIADAALDFFDKNANPGERFRLTIERVGWEKFKSKILNSI